MLSSNIQSIKIDLKNSKKSLENSTERGNSSQHLVLINQIRDQLNTDSQASLFDQPKYSQK